MNAPVNFDPRTHAWSLPLDKLDLSDPQLYYDDVWQPYFERHRKEAPVNYMSRQPVRPILVGGQVPGHRSGRGQP